MSEDRYTDDGDRLYECRECGCVVVLEQMGSWGCVFCWEEEDDGD